MRVGDIKEHEFAPTAADEFLLLDLREPENCRAALSLGEGAFDEVYQLAADMGGMGFIHSAECEIMHNSALINIHMTHTAAQSGVSRYFFSSSACVYRDMQPGEPELTEDEAIPADSAQLVGTDVNMIVKEVFRLVENPLHYQQMCNKSNLYGDGKASERIVKAILEFSSLESKTAHLEPETVIMR